LGGPLIHSTKDGTMKLKGSRFRIHPEERERIHYLKSNLDHQEVLASYAEQYQKLGWDLVALQAQDGTDPQVDFGERPEICINRWWERGLTEPKINLGVLTGRSSRLMVLEVAKRPGASLLDQWGEWRAACRAALGTDRELHFYAWHPSPIFESLLSWTTPGLRWFGEGQIAPAPPSFDPETMETWRWVCPPWENPPQYPSRSLMQFVQQHRNREAQAHSVLDLSWQEIYCLVAPYQPLLQALSTPSGSMEDYYQGILTAARQAGIEAPELLITLLWQAPEGDARRYLGRLDYLQKLVAEAPDQSPVDTSRRNFPDALSLDNTRSDGIENYEGGSRELQARTGRAGFAQEASEASPSTWGGSPASPFRSPDRRWLTGRMGRN
jgi:hypothetical protein